MLRPLPGRPPVRFQSGRRDIPAISTWMDRGAGSQAPSSGKKHRGRRTPMRPLHRMHGLTTASVLSVCLLAGTVAFAQEKKEEEPFWAKGRPKGDVTAKMAPVAAPPVPVAPDKLPVLKAPPGFKVEVYQSGILDARGPRRRDQGSVSVSPRFVAAKSCASTGGKGRREVKTLARGRGLPSGTEYRDGSLYVATS